MPFVLAALIAVMPAMLCAQAALTAEDKRKSVESFDVIWSTIRDTHWEKNPGGLDWDAIRGEYRPKVEAAQNQAEVHKIFGEMLGRLKQTHFGILPAELYDGAGPDGSGVIGVDLRLLDGMAVVTRIDPGSPAEKAGVQPGWALVSAGGKPVAPRAEKLAKAGDLVASRILQSLLAGAPGAKVSAEFLDAGGATRALEITLAEQRGTPARFGNLPPVPVWFESKKVRNSGYVAFNIFLDVPRLMSSFGDAVTSCARCDGLVIDLRGNPGGIGGMAMGMAGWLVGEKDKRLGVMYMRDAKMNFIVNPRIETFDGPVAVLVDGTSASTSEILAGGLQDLKRARIFGTTSAGAALPSGIRVLPNGDRFQYAMANYISEGGKPLEGRGVIPDEEVKLTRQALLAGRDPVLDAALDWIEKSRKGTK